MEYLSLREQVHGTLKDDEHSQDGERGATV